MKLGILHLSDIHISKNDLQINNLAQKIEQACHYELSEIVKLFIVISGDIANTGKKEEYTLAEKFIQELSDSLKQGHYLNSINIILVPGNHDCNFANNKMAVRDKLLSNIEDNVDIEIVNECIKVQDNFWEFYTNLNLESPKSRLSYQLIYENDINSKIIFNCYNTSWTSTIHEKDNDKILPTYSYLNSSKRTNDIVVSVFHHPTSWFNTHTDINHRHSFENHLLHSSNIVLCGHEHLTQTKKISSLNEKDGFVYIEGAALKNEKQSSFTFITIDTKNLNGNYQTYNLSNDQYKEERSEDFILNNDRTDIDINDEFHNKITNIVIPIKHPRIDKLTLPDLFVYPDLEPIGQTDDFMSRDYIDSKEIPKLKYKSIIIEGEEQSGKTSLLYTYFSQLYAEGFYPLYVKGRDLKTHKIKNIIRNSLKEQYKRSFNETKYISLPSTKRILLIDDLDQCPLIGNTKENLINNLSNEFSKIIITLYTDNEIQYLTKNDTLFKDANFFRITPLGYCKRNTLIEKWVRLGIDTNIVDSSSISDQINKTFDIITNLLGEQLVPSYPIFILSLLQTYNNNSQSFNLQETTYAYCYHSLIILSLFREGTNKETVGSIFNFLTELAYYLYSNTKNEINESEFYDFYETYKRTFSFSFSFEKIIELLTKSRLIKEDDNYYYFAYKYLSYYLSAKKISTLISDGKGESEIDKLCKSLYQEQSANILIFITHHTPNNNLIQELLFSSLLPFEDYKPITLKRDDPFFSFLTSFISEIKEEIVLKETDPDEYRARRLRQLDQDEQNKKKNGLKNEDHFNDPNIVMTNQTFKVIKILGQIVKNQHGNFEKEKLSELIEYSYQACFRLINFYSSMLINARHEIIDIISNKIQDTSNRALTEKKVSDFLFYLGYRMCLNSFSSLASAVGVSELESVFDDVATKIDSPAAKLVSFTIKTYYNKMHTRELKILVEEYKDNPVASHIIKARVASHIYNNHIAEQKKQKLCSICNIKLIS